QPTERVIPVPFEGIGDQAVLGSHGEKLALRELGVLAGARDVCATGSIEIGLTGAELLEHLEGDLQRRRRDGLEDEVADGCVERGAVNYLTDRLRDRNAPTL